MALQWEQVVVDAADPVALSRWWAEALGWVVLDGDDEEVEIAAGGWCFVAPTGSWATLLGTWGCGIRNLAYRERRGIFSVRAGADSATSDTEN